MADILTFAPRSRTAAPLTPSPADLRTRIEEAAQAALDTADRLIAILDGMDGGPDDEDGGDAEPSLGAPEDHASQITWLRGTTRDLEIDRQPEPRL